MNEFELKFQVPADRVPAVEADLQRGTVERTALHARYFDTPDEALARAQLVLRVRQEGDLWVQTAKGPGQGSFDRLEHNVQLPAAPGAIPDLARHAGHPVHRLLERALDGKLPGLQPVFDIDVTRLSRALNVEGSSIEVALDRGQIRHGDLSLAVSELEFELKDGAAVAVIELARSWCGMHGLWLDPLSKSALGRRLARGESTGPAMSAKPLDKGGRHLLAAIFDAAMQQVLGNARELAAGTGHEGHVHQLRVGLRQVRTALRELQDAGAWDPLGPELDLAIRTLFTTLGEHRDRSTLIPALLREMSGAASPVQPWQPELPDVGAAVRDRAVQDAFLRLVALAQQLRDGSGTAPRALRQLTGDRLRSLHGRMAKKGRRFEELPQADRHQVRKRLKRLTYIAELVRPLYDLDAVDAYVRSLKKLQDALGRYQDAVAGRLLFEQQAREVPSAWFGAGWLAAREEQLAAACAKACRRAARKAKPFWT